MPKIQYVARNFRADARAMIDRCNQVIIAYQAQGYDLTLRQLYYQAVSRNWIPNSERSYKNLGSLINDARLAGLVDWNAITDRTRNTRSNSHWNDPGDIIKSAANSYAIDKWLGQEYRPYVLVEKEALAGIVSQAASQLDCPWLSCRGYMSQSEMWSLAQRFIAHKRYEGQEAVIIHLGDHDPSGIDMTRDIQERMIMFTGRRVAVERIALNMDQIEQYNPPPNPAKLTDARAASYLAQYGDESWELDALPPEVLTELIQTEIRRWCNMDQYEGMERSQEAQRDQLLTVSSRWDDVVEMVS